MHCSEPLPSHVAGFLPDAVWRGGHAQVFCRNVGAASGASGVDIASAQEGCPARVNTREAAPTWATSGPSALPSLLPVELAADLLAALVGHRCSPRLLLPPSKCARMACLGIALQQAAKDTAQKHQQATLQTGKEATWLSTSASCCSPTAAIRQMSARSATHARREWHGKLVALPACGRSRRRHAEHPIPWQAQSCSTDVHWVLRFMSTA